MFVEDWAETWVKINLIALRGFVFFSFGNIKMSQVTLKGFIKGTSIEALLFENKSNGILYEDLLKKNNNI